MKIGVLGYDGNWSSEKLVEEIKQKTGFGLLIDMQQVSFDLTTKEIYYKTNRLRDLDGLIVKKITPTYSPHIIDQLEVLKILELSGTKLFSKPCCIQKAVNRLTCTIELMKGDIPIPDTVITEDIDTAMDAISRFKVSVLKPLFSSKARGMAVIKDEKDSKAIVKDFKQYNRVLYIQKMIDTQGEDYGLVFIGGEYIGTYARVAKKGSWNTTTYFGGKYGKYFPDKEIIELGYKAQSLFCLDLTCVDIAITPDGPIVFEVSAFGGFKGLSKAHNIDVAKLFSEYVINNL